MWVVNDTLQFTGGLLFHISSGMGFKGPEVRNRGSALGFQLSLQLCLALIQNTRGGGAAASRKKKKYMYISKKMLPVGSAQSVGERPFPAAPTSR